MSEDTISSAVFDSSLLERGTWDNESCKALYGWIKTGDFDEKRLKASRLILFLTERLLGDQISEDGKIRGGRLAESLVHLEDLLIATRSGIGRKFYRDHLNHMIRTALLANAIASKQRAFADSKANISHLVLACLFHDIAYPLAESRTIVGQAIQAMENCYKTLIFPQFIYSYRMSKVTKLQEQLIGTVGLKTEDLGNSIEEFSHSVVGGIEFLDYIRDPILFQPVLEAIVLHDSRLGTEVNIDAAPLLATLIIADELQDWGRPVALEKKALIPEIVNLHISEGIVGGELDYRRESSLSPFRQARGKLRNLRRLKLKAWKLSVNLCMNLPDYDTLDLHELEQCLMDLFARSPELPDVSIDTGQQLFLERYYGVKVTQETHSTIMEALGNGSLTKCSPITKFEALLNSTRAELILIESSIGIPEKMVLRADEGGPFHVVVSDKQDTVVEIYGVGDAQWQQVAEFLAGEMRIFNRLLDIQRVEGESKEFFPQFGDYFLPPDSVRERLENVGCKSKGLQFIDRLRDLRSAMSDGGLFIVDKPAT
jgi:hypothetical protein